MKKILTLIFLLGTAAWMQAQTVVTLSGELLVDGTEAAAGKTVHVSFFGDTIENEAYYVEFETTSDEGGFYTQEFELPEFITQGYLYAAVTDCNGHYVSGWLQYDPSKTAYQQNLQYCEGDPDPVDTLYNISGYVIGDSSQAALYRVYLYHEKGYWLDSLDTYGYYNFEHPLEGGYVIQAMLAPGQDNPRGFVPTYYGQTTSWITASRAYTPATTQQHYYIALMNGKDVSGDGSVQGRLTDNGQPVANAVIYLSDDNGSEIFASTRTAADGSYSFGLREGVYGARVEMFGYVSEINRFVISAENMDAINENFAISGRNIRAEGSTSITDAGMSAAQMVLFPNPVQDQISIDVTADLAETLKFEVISVTGALVMEYSQHVSNGKTLVQIPVSYLEKGFYTVRISGNATSGVLTFIK